MSAQSGPKHVAIIMDGNGRWAERRLHPRLFGHVRGSHRVKEIVKEADRLGIEVLTLFAFSTENWTRPDAEKTVLWKLLKKFLRSEVQELKENNVRLATIGETERFDEDVQAVLKETIDELSGNDGLTLNLALSYGSRAEILRACQRFTRDCLSGKTRPARLDEEMFNRYLWTSQFESLSDVDLVIRTSGEKRVSNFLLWQAAYAEYVFYDICWPDFKAEHLAEAVHEYSQRQRRFGGLADGEESTVPNDGALV